MHFSICRKRSSFDWLCTPVLCPTTGFGVTTDCSKYPEKPSLSVIGCSEGDGFCDLAGGLQEQHRSFEVRLVSEGQTCDTDFNIRWSVRRRATAYQNTTRMCNLCLAEKLEIIKADKKRSLNKRTELVSKCRHENRFYLCNFPPAVP